jgi:predicted dienelactone hydrolase
MTIDNGKPAMQSAEPHDAAAAGAYDPFVRGRFPVGVRTIQARDMARDRLFACEIWYPAAPRHAGEDLALDTQDGFTAPMLAAPQRQWAVRDAAPDPETFPLIIFSHHSGGHRRAATFLCTHLTSHGYVVAALDHSEVVAPELARRQDETEEQKSARREAVIASRVPDGRFLIDCMLNVGAGISLDAGRIGIVGHSFGGWTALAAVDEEPRIRAVVALAPGGASRPRPGILRGKLPFQWSRDVPVLFLVAENDVCLPLDGMYEIFERTPASKQMVILRYSDHMHFLDEVEEMHEMLRQMPMPLELKYLAEEMRPIAELCSGEQANLFVRGLTLSHFDAILKGSEEARKFLSGDIAAQLAVRGVEAIVKSRQLATSEVGSTIPAPEARHSLAHPGAKRKGG